MAADPDLRGSGNPDQEQSPPATVAKHVTGVVCETIDRNTQCQGRCSDEATADILEGFEAELEGVEYTIRHCVPHENVADGTSRSCKLTDPGNITQVIWITCEKHFSA